MTNVITRLSEMGIEIPVAPKPAANYVPWVVSGNLIYVSGQLPMVGADVTCTGLLGRDLDLDAGYKGARLCGINILSQLQSALSGDLERVVRVVRLGGFVACLADFTDQPQVINGASDLMAEVFLDKGHHARAAVGVASLPRGAAVEVEALVQFV